MSLTGPPSLQMMCSWSLLRLLALVTSTLLARGAEFRIMLLVATPDSSILNVMSVMLNTLLHPRPNLSQVRFTCLTSDPLLGLLSRQIVKLFLRQWTWSALMPLRFSLRMMASLLVNAMRRSQKIYAKATFKMLCGYWHPTTKAMSSVSP